MHVYDSMKIISITLIQPFACMHIVSNHIFQQEKQLFQLRTGMAPPEQVVHLAFHWTEEGSEKNTLQTQL